MKALVLCGGIPQIALIKELKSRGITTVLADMNEKVAAREFAENKNISVSRRTGFPGSSLHGHDFYELDILASDSVSTVINGEEMIMRCGAVSFMTPTDFHEYAYGKPFDLYNIQFTEDAVSESHFSGYGWLILLL